MDTRLLSKYSSVFRHADPFAVSEYVNLHVGQHSIGLPKSTFAEASLKHRKFADLDICRISYGGSVRVTSPALETVYHLQVLLRGNCLWRGHKHEHYLVPGELLLINPDDPVDLTYSADCEKFILKMPVQRLESVCDEQRWQYPDSGIRFLRNHYRLNELEGFVSLLAMICQEAEASDSLARIQDHYSQIVGGKLLSLMSSNITRQSVTSRAARLEHLLAYIEANLKLAISTEQLAAVAAMSERSLYGMFEQQMGTSPMQYIKQRKLEEIHSCLNDPNSPVRSITELAFDFSFMHLGRFSESYRQLFGELPSHTLKRRA